MSAPTPGITTQATLTRVVDGDTIEVSISRTFKIRLKDLLVAEKNTLNGAAAKNFVENEVKPGDRLMIFIPANSPDKLMDINSFDRLVGEVWLADGENLSDLIVREGLGRYIRIGEKPHQGE